jgi:hypothetical protein
MVALKKKILSYGLFLSSTLFLSTVPLILGLQGSQSISSYGTIGYAVSWLHTSGIFIYNEAGQRINLYCINFHYGGGQGLTLSDIETIKALGFNGFRLGVYWGLIQPYNETSEGIDTSYFTTATVPLNHGLDDVVNWAVQEDMYFIINLCWTDTWQPPNWGFPGITSDGQRFSALINRTASKERAGMINTWKYIANRYKDVPNIIFELLNEPWVSDQLLAGNDYKIFNEDIISAIESVETNSHLKIVELLTSDPTYEEIIDTAVDISKPNVLWATHRYSPMYDWDPDGSYYHGSFTWHGQYFPAGWGNGTTYVAWRIIRCAEKIHTWNKPWINTEFSKFITQAYWKDWFNSVLSTKAEYKVTGWTLHCYCSDPNSEPGWNIKDPATQQEIMNVISPYMTQP